MVLFRKFITLWWWRAFFTIERMNIRIPELVRWAASALAIVLVALIVLRPWQTAQGGDDAAALINSVAVAPTSAALPSASVALPSASAAMVVVDVIGAVQQPGVYSLPDGARVAAAIEAAGGLAPTADREQVNLAAPVRDGEQVRVPDIGDQTDATMDAPAGEGSALVDINTADAAALEALAGVGPATAQKIIAYREANGPFASIEDLDNVSGLGASTIDKFRDQVTVAP
jgi:competence protein ComEA